MGYKDGNARNDEVRDVIGNAKDGTTSRAEWLRDKVNALNGVLNHTLDGLNTPADYKDATAQICDLVRLMMVLEQRIHEVSTPYEWSHLPEAADRAGSAIRCHRALAVVLSLLNSLDRFAVAAQSPDGFTAEMSDELSTILAIGHLPAIKSEWVPDANHQAGGRRVFSISV